MYNGCLAGDCLFYPVFGPILAASSGAAQATVGLATGVDAGRDEILQAASAVRRDFQPQQFQPDMQAEITTHLANRFRLEERNCSSDGMGRTLCQGPGSMGSIHASFAYAVVPSTPKKGGQLDILITVSAAAQPAGMFEHSCATFEYRRPIGKLFEVSENGTLKAIVRATVSEIAPIVASALTEDKTRIELQGATITPIRRRTSDCIRNVEYAREAL